MIPATQHPAAVVGDAVRAVWRALASITVDGTTCYPHASILEIRAANIHDTRRDPSCIGCQLFGLCGFHVMPPREPARRSRSRAA